MSPGLKIPAALLIAAGIFFAPPARSAEKLSASALDRAFEQLRGAPSRSVEARRFLLRYYARTGSVQARELGLGGLAEAEGTPASKALALLEAYQLTRDKAFARKAAQVAAGLKGAGGFEVSALAAAYQVLEDPTYLERARAAAKSMKRGPAAVLGLLDLYESDFDAAWLEKAVAMSRRGPPAVVDAAAVMGWLRVSQFTDDEALRAKAEAAIARFQDAHEPGLMSALDFAATKESQIIVAGKPGEADTQEMLRLIRSKFLPVKIVMLADGGAGQAKLAERLPFVKGVHLIGGKATAYVCVHYACDLPTTDLAVLSDLLDGKKPEGE